MNLNENLDHHDMVGQINSLVATDILTFIVYSDEFNIDIETGLITK